MKKRGKKRGPVAELYVTGIVAAALAEDMGRGDVTSRAVIPPVTRAAGEILAKENFVVAGLDAAEAAFRLVDKGVTFRRMAKDGEAVKKGAAIARVEGRLRSILAAERVALNFLQRLSAIATLTKKFVALTSGYGVRILDTRKTTPCLRLLEKKAVRAGGGLNHRFGLFDAILIKDNHIEAAGGVKNAVLKAKRFAAGGMPVEVEVKNIREFEEALDAEADIIMLDNMTQTSMKKAVSLCKGRALIEASGGITLENAARAASTGVDFLSIGALTHSAGAVDISLEVTGWKPGKRKQR